MKAVRGAISLEQDTEQAMLEAVNLLVSQFLNQDSLFFSRIISILFSVTGDLKKKNPATALRQLFPEDTFKIPLMVFQEALFDNSPHKILRILINYEDGKEIKPVYSGRAEKLRPDLKKQLGGKS